jgi:hypothetical protein
MSRVERLNAALVQTMREHIAQGHSNDACACRQPEDLTMSDETTGCADDGDELSQALRKIAPERLNELLRIELPEAYCHGASQDAEEQDIYDAVAEYREKHPELMQLLPVMVERVSVLEEAASAMCAGCEKAIPYIDAAFHLWPDGVRTTCYALPIRHLIKQQVTASDAFDVLTQAAQRLKMHAIGGTFTMTLHSGIITEPIAFDATEAEMRASVDAAIAKHSVAEQVSGCCNAPFYFVHDGGPVCRKCGKWTTTKSSSVVTVMEVAIGERVTREWLEDRSGKFYKAEGVAKMRLQYFCDLPTQSFMQTKDGTAAEQLWERIE